MNIKTENIKYSREFAYVIGIIVTDGNLSKDGRHIDITSKDIDQLITVKKILGINKIKIGKKTSGYSGKTYSRIEFSSVKLYRWLQKIGINPKKTKNLVNLRIPDKYFLDFLRGFLDGDGYTLSYYDKRWRNSFMLYTAFISASYDFLFWIKEKLEKLVKINGTLTKQPRSVWRLLYAKRESLKLLPKMYYSVKVPCLKRKRLKIEKALKIVKPEWRNWQYAYV